MHEKLLPYIRNVLKIFPNGLIQNPTYSWIGRGRTRRKEMIKVRIGFFNNFLYKHLRASELKHHRLLLVFLIAFFLPLGQRHDESKVIMCTWMQVLFPALRNGASCKLLTSLGDYRSKKGNAARGPSIMLP